MTKKSLFILGLLSFCLMLAVASPAFAVTRHTRITGLSTSRTISTYKDTGRVTYSKSGHYYAVSRAYVKVYVYKGGKWVYHTHIHATTSGYFKVSEAAGYTYKFKYVGKSHYYYSSYKNTKVVRPMIVTAIQMASRFDIDASLTATASGTLIANPTTTKNPISGALITIVQEATETVITTTTDSQGRWTVGNLPLGEYLAIFEGNSTSLISGELFSVVDPNANAIMDSVVYTDWDEFVLAPSATTAEVSGGVVTFTDGSDDATPLVGGHVKISKLQGDVYSEVAAAETDTEGNWTTVLPVGTYRCSVDAIPSFTTVGGILYDLADSSYEFTVTAAQ